MTSVGPLLPDGSALGWAFTIVLPLVLIALGAAVLYVVVRRAVAAGIRDARQQDVPDPSSTEG